MQEIEKAYSPNIKNKTKNLASKSG